MRCAGCGDGVDTGWKYCPRCGVVVSRAQPQELRGLSVMFVDLVASTRLARAMTSDEYFDLMGEMLRVLAREVESFGGHVVQFQGDAVLASFGAPCAREDDAIRAVRAADACLKAVEAYGERVGLRLHARAGVASGAATAGWVGREYTVFGTVVNLSRRLCSLARSGEVLVSEATRNETWTRANHEVAVGLSVPDYADERGPYRLTGFEPDRREPSPRGTPFVGRRLELAELEVRMQGVRTQDRARLVDVVGGPGSGKSRLMAEFSRRQANALTVTVTPGLTPSDVLMQALAGGAIADSEILREFPRDRGAHDAVGVASPLASGHTESGFHAASAAAVAALLSDFSRRDPLILVLERAALLEPSLRELGEAVLACARALVLRESSVRPQGGDAIELGPLSDDEALALLESGGNPLAPADARDLIARAKGNPLVLELFGRGVAGGTRVVDGPGDKSARRVLLSRLGSLPPSARETLSVATLSPGGFWHGGLEAVLGRRCDEALSVLLDGGWIRPLEPPLAAAMARGSPDFAVPLPLVREAGYELLPARARRAAHVRLGVWLRERAPEAAAEQFRLAGSVAGERAAAHA